MSIRGRVWCFGDDINTDLLMPMDTLHLPRPERTAAVFRANRPGWSAMVEPGDVIVAGKNFGMGSSRPAAEVLKDLGIACVLAESLNGLFARICVNYALPALVVDDVRRHFEEGDVADIDFAGARVHNERTGYTADGERWPQFAVDIVAAGGLLEKLEKEGFVHPAGWTPPLH